MSDFDSKFFQRSSHCQPVASNEESDTSHERPDAHFAFFLYLWGSGTKVGGAFAFLGGAIVVGFEPTTGLDLLGQGAFMLLGGNALKAAGDTLGDTHVAACRGKKESIDDACNKFADKFRSDVFKPW